MTDKEEKAVERCNQLIKVEHANWIGISNQVAIEIVLNELKKKDKIINEMAIALYDEWYMPSLNTVEKMKEYFINKVEKESKDE